MSSANIFFPATSQSPIGKAKSEITIDLTPFDQKHYLKLIEARGETLERVVRKLKPELSLQTVVDAGCGVGFFAKVLERCGLNVCGFDGRQTNVEEARKRFPNIPFEQGDLQEHSILELGTFDLVVCFGLLYHLENPLLAIRNLHAMTGKCLLLESMCLPGDAPSMMLREEPNQSDQSLTDVACYSSEKSLVKMLYRAGFAKVYRVTRLPDHDDFRETREHARRRTMLLASAQPIDVAGFRLLTEPRDTRDPWAKDCEEKKSFAQRVWRFLRSPLRRQYLTLATRMRRIFPEMPIPLRLPFGAWWLAERSALDQELMFNKFENGEMLFVERLLRPGMTVLDVGAHHGLYTLLLSKRVGKKGKVLAFEPSKRECERLTKHLDLNFCSNVKVQNCALGEVEGSAELFLVDGEQDWCNSLRPPTVKEGFHKSVVPLGRLDDILLKNGITKVDFIKLDAEGAELSILKGAAKLLQSSWRPAIFTEVQDIRTRPWGYAARNIIEFLAERNYQWFSLEANDALQPISCDLDFYDANLIALPVERFEEFDACLANKKENQKWNASYKEWRPSLEKGSLPEHENCQSSEMR